MVKYGINQTQAASSNKIRFKMHLLPSLTPELIYSNITASLRSKIYEFFFFMSSQLLHKGTMPDLWQDAMDHAVTLARKAGEVR